MTWYYKQCEHCNKKLKHEDAIVQLRVGVKDVDMSRWAIAVLCAPTADQVKFQMGSPCVNAFRELYTKRGYTIVAYEPDPSEG